MKFGRFSFSEGATCWGDQSEVQYTITADPPANHPNGDPVWLLLSETDVDVLLSVLTLIKQYPPKRQAR